MANRKDIEDADLDDFSDIEYQERSEYVPPTSQRGDRLPSSRPLTSIPNASREHTNEEYEMDGSKGKTGTVSESYDDHSSESTLSRKERKKEKKRKKKGKKSKKKDRKHKPSAEKLEGETSRSSRETDEKVHEDEDTSSNIKDSPVSQSTNVADHDPVEGHKEQNSAIITEDMEDSNLQQQRVEVESDQNSVTMDLDVAQPALVEETEHTNIVVPVPEMQEQVQESSSPVVGEGREPSGTETEFETPKPPATNDSPESKAAIHIQRMRRGQVARNSVVRMKKGPVHQDMTVYQRLVQLAAKRVEARKAKERKDRAARAKAAKERADARSHLQKLWHDKWQATVQKRKALDDERVRKILQRMTRLGDPNCDSLRGDLCGTGNDECVRKPIQIPRGSGRQAALAALRSPTVFGEKEAMASTPHGNKYVERKEFVRIQSQNEALKTKLKLLEKHSAGKRPSIKSPPRPMSSDSKPSPKYPLQKLRRPVSANPTTRYSRGKANLEAKAREFRRTANALMAAHRCEIPEYNAADDKFCPWSIRKHRHSGPNLTELAYTSVRPSGRLGRCASATRKRNSLRGKHLGKLGTSIRDPKQLNEISDVAKKRTPNNMLGDENGGTESKELEVTPNTTLDKSKQETFIKGRQEGKTSNATKTSNDVESIGEESVDEESVGEESVGEESVGEESIGEQSVGEESVGEESIGEQSVGEESVGEESIGEQSVGEESVGEESIGVEETIDKRKKDKDPKMVKTTRTTHVQQKPSGHNDDYSDDENYSDEYGSDNDDFQAESTEQVSKIDWQKVPLYKMYATTETATSTIKEFARQERLVFSKLNRSFHSPDLLQQGFEHTKALLEDLWLHLGFPPTHSSELRTRYLKELSKPNYAVAIRECTRLFATREHVVRVIRHIQRRDRLLAALEAIIQRGRLRQREEAFPRRQPGRVKRTRSTVFGISAEPGALKPRHRSKAARRGWLRKASELMSKVYEEGYCIQSEYLCLSKEQEPWHSGEVFKTIRVYVDQMENQSQQIVRSLG